MTSYEKKAAIENLLVALTEKNQQYRESSNRDDILSVKKTIRQEIRDIMKQIAELRESVDGQLQWQKAKASRNPTFRSGSTAFTLGGQSLSVLRETYNYLK